MKPMTIFAVILGVLVLISAVQALQLNDLKTKLSNGQVKVSSEGTSKTAAVTTQTTSQGSTANKPSSLPSSIKDLPQQVGGC